MRKFAFVFLVYGSLETGKNAEWQRARLIGSVEDSPHMTKIDSSEDLYEFLVACGKTFRKMLRQ